MLAFKKSNLLSQKTSFFLLAGASIYGFGLEVVQYSFFEYRYFEWIDALANVLGVLIGFGLFKIMYRG